MEEQNTKADFILVDEVYFGKVGHGIKNRLLKSLVDFIFSDKVRKKKFSYSSFSLTFEGTEVQWYSNFMNGFFKKVSNVKCFFTKDNDNFIVYPVPGKPEATSYFAIPKKVGGYVGQRKNEWQKEDKKWSFDESSVKKKKEGEQYSLEYRGEYKSEEGDYNVFEHTAFKGRDKVVLQAFILKNSDKKVMKDIEKIAHGIVMH